jgi:hypothetical protein
MNPPSIALKEIKLDPNFVAKDPRAAAIERLREMAEERKRKEEETDEPTEELRAMPLFPQ